MTLREILDEEELDQIRKNCSPRFEQGETHELVRESEENVGKPKEKRNRWPITMTKNKEFEENLRLGSKPILDQRHQKYNICEQSFEQRSYLSNHKHWLEEPNIINDFGEIFSANSIVQADKKIPSGKILHYCHYCRKAFGYSANLVKHQRLHNEEKPFKCCECGKTFHKSCEFINHQRIHSGEILTVVKSVGRHLIEDPTS